MRRPFTPIAAMIAFALSSAATASWASGTAMDLNGDGKVDAYYDAAHDQTWLAHASGAAAGTETSFRAYKYLANDAFGGTWRLPKLLETPHLTQSQCSGWLDGFGQYTCTADLLTEVSRLDADFAINPFSWGTPNASVIANGYPTPLTPLLGRDQTSFLADPSDSAEPVWLLTDGEFGVPIPAVPEPASVALLSAGLAAIAFARRRRASKAPSAPAD